MANELEVMIRAVFSDPSSTGYLKNQKFDFGSTKHTLTNRLVYSDVISVTTADTAFSIGGIGAATQGCIGFVNLDATNFVNFGPSNGGTILPCIRLKPNKKHWTELVPSVSYRWQADTATCKVFVMILGI